MIKSEQRDELRKNLSTKGIATVINYPKALPFYKAYEYLNHQSSDFPDASYNQKRILSLPIFPEISTEQIEYTINAIYEFNQNFDNNNIV